eukprot:scaffold204_cov114-Skeletonema_marinoi.AAC.1
MIHGNNNPLVDIANGVPLAPLPLVRASLIRDRAHHDKETDHTGTDVHFPSSLPLTSHLSIYPCSCSLITMN